MRVCLALAVLVLTAGGSGADPLRNSPLPVPRPSVAPEATVVPETALAPAVREAPAHPHAEPAPPTARELQPAVSAGSELARAQLPKGLARSPRPRPRPGPGERRAERPVSSEPARVLRSGEVGAICGLGDIIGQRIDPIPGRLRGCGIADPVRVARVAGVKLSRPTTMDCRTARTLRHWVENGVKPTLGRFNMRPERLEVAGGYSCRTINHRPGGDISEHGRGRAIDISGIGVGNGRYIRLIDGWGRRVEGQILRRLHRAACGPFGTVLGPDADRFHLDHFHFDTKPRRSPYCR